MIQTKSYPAGYNNRNSNRLVRLGPKGKLRRSEICGNEMKNESIIMSQKTNV
jgi:hypothetical protein